MSAPETLIVQPWFTAIGHPAQSTLNTAKALGARGDVGYLISDPRGGTFEPLAVELGHYGPVTRFKVPGDSLRLGTLFGILALIRFRSCNFETKRIFFLDGYLVALAVLWPLVSRCLPSVRSLAAVYLGGPERIASHALARVFVSRFLSIAGRRLFLRTEELACAWRAAFPGIPPERIDTIPSLEIPDRDDARQPEGGEGCRRFGVMGQIRPGKSLEWLVPLFSDNPNLGKLRVAGTFSNPAHRNIVSVLEGYPEFDDRFLTESEMLAAASEQDYIVALYDDWDARMEAAAVFFAARVQRPVIVYDEGWCGRMVKEFGCGIAVPKIPHPDKNFFSKLPRPGEDDYRKLLAGIERFRDAHGGASSREVFLAKLRGQ